MKTKTGERAQLVEPLPSRNKALVYPYHDINQVSCCLPAGPALMGQMQDSQFQVIFAIYLLYTSYRGQSSLQETTTTIIIIKDLSKNWFLALAER